MIKPPESDDVARRGAFASMVAHELRTPLTAAHGALEMMSRESVSADDGRTAVLIDLAHRSTQRLLRIVEDCLDLEAASDDRLTLERSTVDPDDVVGHGVDLARLAIEQTGTAVVFEGAAQCRFTGDRGRLGRALAHLIQNAVSFAPRGTAVVITTCDDHQRGTVRFTVEDRGAGIEPEQLRTLFQRFDCRETPGRSRVAGLGMGLAFVCAIAEAHGGGVGARSAAGKTEVWMEVPWGVNREP
jgi:signal transduction histidine kinase